ncbi:alpha amylase C-terminal domain-containing protein [Azospirillum canadense]|uniref:alpha amylase C-terminal domain-containing protein n=1 Tax=Azospirillum canadense TaxID=403962 RepID=UPI0022263EF1|nr:alpha amylase C-terminal domain-containing protein [Azospirillum canadense]MCW2240556.1 1,4-alpha-glucan branching enzyme [Azospirillum canadense]
MPVLNQFIGRDTRMGATVVDGGVAFRTWAPHAHDVFVVCDQGVLSSPSAHWTPDPTDRLIPLGDGTWTGFVPFLADGAPYLFWIRGRGTSGFKRDPYARELGTNPPFPNSPCVARNAANYPWHDAGWRPPAFHELIIYQLHVGVFWAVDAFGKDRRKSYGRFLDVVEKIPYLQDLGINAIQPLPVQEYDGDVGLGYSGLDYFSPEMSYVVEDPTELDRHLATVNRLLAVAGQTAVSGKDLMSGPNQLKCLVDLCHIHGIAVILDVVYNHAGGDFGDRSLYFYDRQWQGDDERSLYFGHPGWAGGKVFAYGQAPVRQFLIDNATFYLDEFHADGFRYDEISVASNFGGDRFCRDLADTVRYHRPNAVQIAEYWNWDRAKAVTPTPDGLGFDAALADGLRIALRDVLHQAAGGQSAHISLNRVRDALYSPPAFPAAWRANQCLENHDIVRWDYDNHAPREPRIPAVADPTNARSWYARSRSRVATTLLMTAPGIPTLFMGQEFLEDKPWHDDVRFWSQFLIWWDGLAQDRVMADFLRFTRDLVHLRRRHPALQGEGVRIPQVHEQDRVIAMHRWVNGEGKDIVVVASLNENTLEDYRIDLPWPGRWHEIFNSDFYDDFPNPAVIGNAGSVQANAPPGATYPHTARVRIPANGALVFEREV